MSRPRRRGWILPALFACFCLGLIVGWWLRAKGPPLPDAATPVVIDGPQERATVSAPDAKPGARTPAAGPSPNARAAPSDSAAPVATVGAEPSGALQALRRRDLRVPIDGAQIESWKGAFEEHRDGRAHEAVDILAPRNTSIHAVDDGTIAKLFESKAGGHTIYQFDRAHRFCYYYAHLERYEPGLADGKKVSRGDVIGYVGTSGNAPPNTPHLHFTIFELTDANRWWDGRPIDPYLAFTR